MTYAEHYMNRLLDIEDRIGQDFEHRVEQLVERKLRLLFLPLEGESEGVQMVSEKSSENNK